MVKEIADEQRTKPTADLRPLALVAGVLISLALASPAFGQDACSQPTDIEYQERMALAEAANRAGTYEEALAQYDWARELFAFSPILYGRARALHRLGRYNEASEAYDIFLLEFESCADPTGLRELANDYYQASLVEQQGAPSEGPDLPPFIPDDHNGSESSSVLRWSLLGAGGALILGGIIYDAAHVADLGSDRDAAQERHDVAAVEEANEAISDANLVDGLLYGVGIAAVAAGAIIWALEDEPETQSASPVQVDVRGDGLTFHWSTEF